MKFVLMMILGAMAALTEESEVLREFSVRNNLFANDVYQVLLPSHPNNFLVCPLSAEIGLTLLQHSAERATAQQLSTALHIPESKRQTFRQMFQELTRLLGGSDKYTLLSANKIYVKDGYKIKDQFIRTANHIFRTDVQSINLENTTLAASQINRWVEDKTLDKVKDLIKKEDLDDETLVVLINVMYFQGQWVHEFPYRATKVRPFYPYNNKQIKVAMMQQFNEFNFYHSSELNAKFLELPYEGNDVTMTIVLPNDVEGLKFLEGHIAEVLAAPQYRRERVDVVLPKFTVNMTLELKPTLRALGIIDAFEGYARLGLVDDFKKHVNFDGTVDQPLKISKVIQKTVFVVEERGAIPSAASADETGTPPSGYYAPVTFVANHPFIYYIKIKDIVLFVGKYSALLENTQEFIKDISLM